MTHHHSNRVNSSVSVSPSLDLLRAVADAASNALFVKDIHGRYLFCNAEVCRLFGLPLDQLVGQCDVNLFGSTVAEIIRVQDQRVMATGAPETEEHVLCIRGTRHVFEATISPYLHADGSVIGVIGVARNITKKRTIESAFLRQQEILERIASGVPLHDVLNDLVALIEDELPDLICSFLLLDPDGQHLHVAAGPKLSPLYNSAIDGISIGPKVGSCGTAAYRGERVLVADIATDPLWDDYRELALAHGLRACWSNPILSRKSGLKKVLGTFAIYSRQPGLPDQRYDKLLLRVEYLACVAIEAHLATQEIQASETRFRTFVENTSEAFFLHDQDSRVLDVNQRACEFLGYTREELIGELPTAFDPQVTLPQLQSLASALDRGERPVLETYHQRKDGTKIPVEVRLSPFKSGNERHSIATVQDISERRLADEKIRRHQKLLEQSQALAHLGSFDWDLRTNRSTWSDELYRIYGYKPGEIELTFEVFLTHVHPEDQQRVKATVQEACRLKSSYRMEERILRPDGEVRVLESRGQIVLDDQQQAVRVIGSCLDVTDRKRAEAELRRTADLLQAVAEGTTDAVFVKDRSGQYILANSATCNFIGKPSAEILGRDDSAFFDAAGAEQLFEHDRKVMAAGIVQTYEETLTADGVTRTYLATKGPYRDDQGNIVGLIGISRDITKRKEAERTLLLNQFSIDHAVDSVFWISPSSEILYVNEAVCRTLGYTRDELIGKNVPDIDPNFPADAWPAHWEELKSRKSLTFESDHVTKDGRILKTEVTANYLQFDGQEYNCAVMRDITSRKQAEEAIRQSLSQLQATLESTADGILVVDLQGRIIGLNQQFLSVWGFPAGRITEGRKDDLIASFNNHQAIQDMLKQLKDPAAFVDRVQTIYQTPDRSSFDVLEFRDGRMLERFSQPQLIDGKPVGRVWSFRNITERTKLEEQLRQSQKMEAVGQLAGGIAHDFNNLLTVINGYCDLLLADHSKANPWAESVLEIRESGRRAAQLTEQLLAFSRRSRFQPQTIKLDDVIRGSHNLLRRLIGEHISLSVQLDSSFTSIKADANLLEQVLMNLAVNSRDAMPGGGRLTIVTHVVDHVSQRISSSSEAERPTYIQLTVTDTGSGMTPEVQSRIFEPFFTTKEPGKGSGLGLAVVHGIMQQHQGEIQVTSAPGEGTEFTLFFPIVDQDPLPQTRAQQQVTRKGTETILLVEDEPSLRKMVRIMLNKQGYHVLEAGNGHDALSMIEQANEQIHLLLTDVVMPGIGGHQLAKTLRQGRPNLRVVYISGYHEDENVRDALLTPQEIFLRKPFSPQELFSTIRDLIDADIDLRQN